MDVAFVGGVRRKGDIVWKDECIAEDDEDEEVDFAVEKRVVVVVVVVVGGLAGCGKAG